MLEPTAECLAENKFQKGHFSFESYSWGLGLTFGHPNPYTFLKSMRVAYVNRIVCDLKLDLDPPSTWAGWRKVGLVTQEGMWTWWQERGDPCPPQMVLKKKAASYPLLPSHQSGDSFFPLEDIAVVLVFFFPLSWLHQVYF